MKKYSLQGGFTLIELMLVVSIIGILAAIAVPSFREYTKRAQFSEGLTLVRPVQVAVAEYFDRWGRLPADNASAGMPPPKSLAGTVVRAIQVSQGSIDVEMDFGNQERYSFKLSPVINPAQPGAALTWKCGTEEGKGRDAGAAGLPPLPTSMLPRGCK